MRLGRKQMFMPESFAQTFSDAAEVNGSNEKIRGDVAERDLLHEIRVFIYEVKITLCR